MAQHKLDVLHWHLTDDQGWRIQIKRYPGLTRLGAWRTPPHPGRDGAPPRYRGFYTQSAICALVAYAAARHIPIVPALYLPRHAPPAVRTPAHPGRHGNTSHVSLRPGRHP